MSLPGAVYEVMECGPHQVGISAPGARIAAIIPNDGVEHLRPCMNPEVCKRSHLLDGQSYDSSRVEVPRRPTT